MTTPPSRDSKSDLLDAARAAIQDREDKAAEAAVTGRLVPRQRWLGLLAAIGLAGIILLLIQPVWLVGPAAPPRETAPVAVASLRLALLRQRALIATYVRTRGRLPMSLAEAGDSVPGVTYIRLGGQDFRLTASAGDSVISLRSTDSAETFLGRSIRIIRNRGQ